MVEYGLIVAVISLMALAAVTLLGDSTEDTFNTIAAELDGQGADQGSSGNESASDESEGQDSDAGDSDNSSDSDQDDEQGSDDEETSDDEENLDQQSEDDAADDDDAGNSDDEQDSEGDDGSDDTGNDDSDDTGDDSQDEEDESPGPPPNSIASDSELYWWNSTRHGGKGAWTASVTYSNDTNRHQYLDLEITRVDEKGKETVSQSKNFYVPANGSGTYTHWSNSLEEHKGKLRGTVKVRVEVKSIKTSDENWQSFTYEVDEQPVSVEAPETP